MSERGVKSLLLQGKRILVTRTRQQASALSKRLRALGAIPIEFPTIHIVPPQDWEPLDSALRRLCKAETDGAYYTWLILTSVNGVNICFERLRSIGYDAGAIGNVRVAAIGPATAAALARYGVITNLVPGEFIAEGVAAAVTEDALRQTGAIVDEVAAYRTSAVANDDEQGREVLHLLQTRQLDILTFTSSSTVRNFMRWLVECESGDPARSNTYLVTHNPRPKIACIGPITSQTACELGLDVDIEAREFTIEGLVEAIVQHEEKI